MERYTSSEGNNHSRCQDILRFFFVTDFARDRQGARTLRYLNSFRSISPYFIKIHFNIILIFTSRSSKSSPPFWLSNYNFVCIYFPLIHSVCPAYLIHFELLTLKYFVKSTNYEGPHYVIFSNLLFLPLSLVQIFS
jgi:hypothetical protein